ncbi:MAG: endonuclease/exonuclease/phosphatase family protein [Deltaproteobacteria bacterium]|nr:endonuclease/exonuclease/phosphatase family protein [Deltaproteobacteria bacterium]
MRSPSSAFLIVLTGLSLASPLGGCASETDEEVLSTSDEVKGKAKTTRFDVITHNIGGGAENDPGDKGIAYTFGQIDERDPDVVMLEEVCLSQYESMKRRYPKWKVLFSQMRASHPGCANAEPKGQVLASRHPMSEVLREDLGDVDPAGDKHFTLLCGAVSVPKAQRKVVSCVTHLRAHDTPEADAARERQAKRIHGLVRGFVRDGRPVVLAGDFNSGPHEDTLDPIYRLTRSGGFNGGLFDEADQTDPRREENAKNGVRCAGQACRSGEGTLSSNGAKLDYVFFSHDRVGGGLSAGVYASGGSGHRLYRAWADLEL